MLVLTRRPGETITITLPDGRLIEIQHVGIHGSGVRLGFTCDRDIKVMRTEVVCERVDYEKRGVRA